jgi:energy-coupling factor transporter ATP-binding protein EcfA2
MSVAPRSGSALVVLAPELLRYPYHARYELLEFAVYCLAGRAQQLVPLHAACVGGAGAAALLLGASGAGKSTLTLHCLLGSLELLAEDSVLVEPRQMLATGVGSFLHLRMRARHYAEGTPIGQKIARSPVIRRRSGERKFEFDLRAARLPLARAPLPLRTLVFLSRARAAQGELLVPLSPATATRRLAVSQRYAASQPGWQQFLKRALQLPAYELRRGAHPGEGAAALARILASLGQRDAHPKAAKSARAARARTAGGKDSLSRPAATFAAATNS